MLRRFGLTLTLLLGLVVALGCSSSSSDVKTLGGTPSDDGATRVEERDGITVEARWLTEAELAHVDVDLQQYPPGAFVLMELALDTHSGDLNEIELPGAATLRRGPAEEAAEAWVSKSDDSHHRSGVLVFRRLSESGPVELALSVAGEAVVLLWETPPEA